MLTQYDSQRTDLTHAIRARMQSYRLTVDKFLDHAAKWFATNEIVEADAGRVVSRTRYAELRERSNRLSGALSRSG